MATRFTSLCLLLICAPAAEARIQYRLLDEVPVYVGQAAGPQAMVVADVNRDGANDLVVTDEEGGAVVYVNDGTGHFADEAFLSADGLGTAVVVADLNRDNRMDIVLAQHEPSGIAPFLQEHDFLEFSLPESMDEALRLPAPPLGLVAGRFDGDAVIDLAVLHAGHVSLWRGVGNGTFGKFSPDTLATGSGTPQNSAIASGDFNRDSLLDLAVSNRGTNRIALFYGRGDGTFQPPQFIVTKQQPRALLSGELGGACCNDDLAWISGDDLDVLVELLTDAGKGIAQQTDFVDTGAHTLAAGDLDDDGKTDLVVGYQDSGFGGVELLCRQPSEVCFEPGPPFWPPVLPGEDGFQIQLSSSQFGETAALAVGDVNGNRKADILVLDLAGETVKVFVDSDRADPTGSPSSTVATTPRATSTPTPTRTSHVPDPFEPDSPRNAQPITCGSSGTYTISPATDTDWFTLSVPRRMQVVIATRSEVIITLRQGARQIDSNSQRLDLVCGINSLAAGDYLVEVGSYGDSTKTYPLEVTCRPCDLPDTTPTPSSAAATPTAFPSDSFEPDDVLAQAKPIACGETQHRTLSAADGGDWLRFDVDEATQIIIETSTSDPFYVSTNLVNRDLRYVDSGELITHLCGRNPLDASEYYISVGSPYSDGVSVAYDIRLLCLPCSQPTVTATPTRTPPPSDAAEPDDDRTFAKPIACNTTLSRTLSPSFDEDWFSLSLAGMTQVIIETTNLQFGLSDTVDFRNDYISLSPFGSTRVTKLCGINALEAGDHLIRVGSSSATGPYDISVSCEPCDLPNPSPTPTPTAPAPDRYEPDDTVANAKPIACGESQTHSFSRYDDVDWLSFSIAETSQVIIRGGAVLSLYDDAMNRLGQHSQINRLCDVDALAPGTYRIKAGDPFQRSYQVSLMCAPCESVNATPTATHTPKTPSAKSDSGSCAIGRGDQNAAPLVLALFLMLKRRRKARPWR